MVDSRPEGPLLIQFAKWPEKGRVKTRLAASIGDEKALAAHIRLTEHVLDNLHATGFPLQLWWNKPPGASAAAPGLIQKIRSLHLEEQVQVGSDLGERMSHALVEGLRVCRSVIIVGSDCPAVDEDYILQAIQRLQGTEVVLGPADDGGYILLGARRAKAGMLSGVRWGSHHALADTEKTLKRMNLSVSRLEARWDVDDNEDWERYLATL
ncbi:TIGR04282 family arsenosugar biosynthesis glycosyltransferase [Marinobacteraceae bacterium S3BR75-40.1]